MTRRLLISFSGGETSALMAKLCVERLTTEYDEVRCVFANTGEENEATLEFVDRCDKAFGLNVVWIEAVTTMQKGVGQSWRQVDFATAARNGEPFEALIAKYGIPNPAQPSCTKGLKSEPIERWARDTGWKRGSYDLAIGIRVDEIDRMSPRALERRIIYPLVGKWPHTKPAVNEFWRTQPFRLPLKGYQGNCRWCWKKSLRKHLTIISETPEAYDFPERMEREHSLSGNGSTGEPRRFFRDNRTVAELREMAAKRTFEPASDDARHYQTDMFGALLDQDLDYCGSESCEVAFDELDPEDGAP